MIQKLRLGILILILGLSFLGAFDVMIVQSHQYDALEAAISTGTLKVDGGKVEICREFGALSDNLRQRSLTIFLASSALVFVWLILEITLRQKRKGE
jgi:hypothetical protein